MVKLKNSKLPSQKWLNRFDILCIWLFSYNCHIFVLKEINHSLFCWIVPLIWLRISSHSFCQGVTLQWHFSCILSALIKCISDLNAGGIFIQSHKLNMFQLLALPGIQLGLWRRMGNGGKQCIAFCWPAGRGWNCLKFCWRSQKTFQL